MNVCGVTFGGYLAKILSFKTGNLLNNSKFHLLSEGTVNCLLPPYHINEVRILRKVDKIEFIIIKSTHNVCTGFFDSV